jgi:hypothetical protein
VSADRYGVPCDSDRVPGRRNSMSAGANEVSAAPDKVSAD